MKRFLPLIVLLFVLVADQSSKIVIRSQYGSGGPLEGRQTHLLGGFLWLNYHENRGVAFGLFSRAPTAVTIPLFVLISLGAIAVVLYLYRRLQGQQLVFRVALMMVLGGALGNLIDRALRGSVTDFMEFAVYRNGVLHNLWPIWNLADASIVIGVIILTAHILFSKQAQPGEAARPTAGDHDSEHSVGESPTMGHDFSAGTSQDKTS